MKNWSMKDTWERLAAQASADENVSEVLESLEQIEDALEEGDVDAVRLRVPYGNAEGIQSPKWK